MADSVRVVEVNPRALEPSRCYVFTLTVANPYQKSFYECGVFFLYDRHIMDVGTVRCTHPLFEK
jgi:hypothetical protein